MSWCTIESDPGVFTELIRKFGVKGAHFREFYTMDEESFQSHEPLYGLIFLFRWQKDAGAVPPTGDDTGRRYYDGSGEVYFANQVINNACGTQAIIHILMNADTRLDIGPMLTDFKSFTGAFPPDLVGEALNNQPAIRTAHNSFKRPEPFVFEKSLATDDDDVYHFIAYVPIGNKVFELDGLKKSPVLLGEIPEGGKWYNLARDAIGSRISKAESSEIRWALMGLRQDDEVKAATVRSQLRQVKAALGEETDGKAEEDIDMSTGSSFELATSPAGLAEQKAQLEARVAMLDTAAGQEKEMMKRWQKENVRRKHNYVPLAVELLNILAEQKQLQPLVEAGKKKAEEQREHARKRKAELEAAKKKREADKAAAAAASAESAAGDGAGAS